MRAPRGIPNWCRQENAALVQEIYDELESHLELAAEAEEERGGDPLSAREAVRERLGDLDEIAASCLWERMGFQIMMRKVINVGFGLLILACGLLLAQTHQLQAQVAKELDHRMNQQARLTDLLEQEREKNREVQAEKADIVEPGDVIETYDRHREIDIGNRYKVHSDGKILLEHFGWHSVTGYSREDLGTHLSGLFSTYYEDLTIDVEIIKQYVRE